MLIDTSERYAGTAGITETFTARANLLHQFGWQVLTVPLKDWWEAPEGVLDLIDREMNAATLQTP